MEKPPVPGYEILSLVGSGSYSSVYRARHAVSGIFVAVKVVSASKLSEKLRRNLLSEIEILKNLQHPNIVKLFETQQVGANINLILELCNAGDLGTLLASRRKQKSPISEAEAKDLMTQCAHGMQFVHHHNIIHRDLKPTNLLLHRPSETPSGFVLKLGDFGFAKIVEEEMMVTTGCGTPMYMAPEIIAGKVYSSNVDLWSIGVILYEMLTGERPFNAPNLVLLQDVISKTADSLTLPPTISEDCRDLLRKLLRVDPKERLSFEMFFRHPFFADKPVSAPSPFTEQLPERLVVEGGAKHVRLRLPEPAEVLGDNDVASPPSPPKEPLPMAPASSDVDELSVEGDVLFSNAEAFGAQAFCIAEIASVHVRQSQGSLPFAAPALYVLAIERFEEALVALEGSYRLRSTLLTDPSAVSLHRWLLACHGKCLDKLDRLATHLGKKSKKLEKKGSKIEDGRCSPNALLLEYVQLLGGKDGLTSERWGNDTLAYREYNKALLVLRFLESRVTDTKERAFLSSYLDAFQGRIETVKKRIAMESMKADAAEKLTVAVGPQQKVDSKPQPGMFYGEALPSIM